MKDSEAELSDAARDPIPADERGESFSISQLAKEFRITTRTIRFYEDEKLISPLRSGKQRIYSSRDHTRLKLILRGKRLGFSLTEIRDMLDLYNSEPGETGQLRLALAQAAKRKLALEQQLDDLHTTLNELLEFEKQCRARLREMDH